MLGEDHSLVNDFPDLTDVISRLIAEDQHFADDNRRYTALDKEIRTLELRGGPIDDQEMHKLKHDRAQLKDSLYQRLLQAN